MSTRKPNLIERLGLSLAGGYFKEAIADVGGGTIDPDDDLFHRLSGSNRDLNPVTQDRAQKISLHLWRSNPMAKRIIEMIVDFTVGADPLAIHVEGENDQLQRVLDDFWYDPAMDLAYRIQDLVRDLSIYGELLLKRNSGPSGLRLGFMDAMRIEDIVPLPDNALVDAKVIRRSGTGDRSELNLVRWVDGDDAAAAGLDVSGSWQGDAFYHGINRVTGQHRGTPDLFAIADWVDGYDQLLFNALERSGLINAFIYDVTLKGADHKAIGDWLKEHAVAPSPGSVRVHNEQEVWEVVAPNLNNADLLAIGRPIKNQALGGAGLPEAWYAEGDSANRATLDAQGDPTYKMLRSRQRFLQRMFERWLALAVQDAVGDRLPEGSDQAFQVVLPDISQDDTQKMAMGMVPLTNALATAVAEEFIDTANARRVFLTVASGFGVNLNIADVEKALDAAAADKAQSQQDRLDALALLAKKTEPAVAMAVGSTPQAISQLQQDTLAQNVPSDANGQPVGAGTPAASSIRPAQAPVGRRGA